MDFMTDLASATCGPSDLKYARSPSCSQKFHQKHIIMEDEKLGDGFYDCGRGPQVLPNLDCLRQEAVYLQGREVILLDTRIDADLKVKADKMIALTSSLPSDRQKAQFLGIMVSNYFGGSNTHLIPNTEIDVKDVKKRLYSNVVPIGRLQFGVCRHRALVFKFVADQIGLKCRLVRGDYTSDNGVEGHAWNVVILQREHFLCDIMHEPGELYPENSAKAENYKRIIREGDKLRVAGGAGMSSLTTPLGEISTFDEMDGRRGAADDIEALRREVEYHRRECAIKDEQITMLHKKINSNF